MDIKEVQQIADGLMPDILRGPAAYEPADPAKDVIKTTKRDGKTIVLTEQFPDEQNDDSPQSYG